MHHIFDNLKARLTKDEQPTRVETTLFQCPDCDAVFVATEEKHAFFF
jgi:uncharacterized C2H2 Zn-finger protein